MAEVTLPARARVEAGLADLVVANRFTIAVVFPAVGAVLLTASAEGVVPEPLAFDPYLVLFGALVMRLPLIAGIAPLVGRRAAAGLGLLTVYAYTVEYVGTTTGVPYGPFAYGVDLGPMLFGQVPVGLPVFFIPLVVNAYLLVLLLLGDRAASRVVRLPSAVATVLLMDLVLDPGAVALGFWTYDAAGAYHGVPWTNFAGWLLSATVAVATLEWAFARSSLRDRLENCEFVLDDVVSFVVLWGAVNAFFGQWVPVALAALLGIGLWRASRFDVPSPPWLARRRT